MLRFTETSLIEERVQQLDVFTRLLSNSIGLQNEAILSVDEDHRQLLNEDGINCLAWRLYDRELDLVDQWQAVEFAQSVDLFPSALRYQTRLAGQLQRTVDFPTLINIFIRSDPKAQFIIPLLNNKRFIGLLELSYSLNDVRLKLLKSQTLILIYIVLYALILVAAGYYLLLRNIIRPARNLLDATDAVVSGDLDKRLPVAGPLEISQLAQAYNRMVTALKVSRSETESHISMLEQTNQQLEETRNELVRREKMVSVGQLAAGLAHELGNPLAALIGYLELLKNHVATANDRDIVERSLTETTRIDFLVRELLDFSRPHKNEQLDFVDVAEELKACVQLLKNQGHLKTVEVSHHYPQSVPAIKINRNKLRQVFVNLLLNAVQACDEKGVITLNVTVTADTVQVFIADNGKGIAASDLNRIFDPFFTTKAPGKGTGLGLTMCQRIVEEAGGRIEVESAIEPVVNEPMVKTTVYTTFPRWGK